ncbi:LLM class flavin-dependent oxidoreductase [Pandoraea apista]|uniref:Nitrilotriacetate monooxygenase n=1 Tax=Pandoraea apista TaxID=93218 RepID=A0A5E5NYL9_9BURK|nr:LLM class flavin-dependent oxidoreductase [Pandoraea apista]AJE98302.1 nitrilotriacetate monooxygenase [Pandoraea apista]AKH72354.1 nitrilotriacetate monooxygenase [Pandoraea apista]AKI60745.1 nitrilotriacetate monooxygenase [Pandoraea apista]OXS95007.1 nitrilotriacetate monooxygenase [Pandoraea apista]VVG69351.1 nitrilotriacetate monooxygenase [Pandoraea apista]
MTTDRKMKLGLSMRYLGYHVAAWRHPEVPADGALDYRYFLANAQKAEAAKFDMIFFADGLGIRAQDNPRGALARDMRNAELEPLTLLAAIAANTSHIGLVATASTTYNEPFHVARKFASIDHISGGRAGWNVVTSWSNEEARNFGRDEHLGYEERYERADEFVEVVKSLWQSWEDDAFVRDKASGVFYDERKLHVPNHSGKHFQVRGPLNSARTPQGRPLIVQAGASEAGRALAAREADLVYSNSHNLAHAQAYYRDLKARLAAHGRAPDDLLIMPGLTPFVGRTRQEAQDKFDQLQELIDPISGLASLYDALGDLSGYPVDGPVPQIEAGGSIRSIAENLLAMARSENLTIRQLYQRVAATYTVRMVIGTPADIADQMEAWFRNEAADGFNICPATLPHGIDDMVELVVPELRRRGLFRTEYDGTTLRANLGLKPLTFRQD